MTKIKTTGKYLFKTKCKWETKVRGVNPPPHPEVRWALTIKLENGLRAETIMMQ
jgi:hypothetical protein